MNYPSSIQNLINQFSQLPGIGPKTAERFVFHLLKQSPEQLNKFAKDLTQLKNKTVRCSICQNFTDQKTICVVAEPQDIIALEKIGDYQGVYHVLGGLLNSLDNITPDKLTIDKLTERIKNNQPKEIILALNPNIEGESTALYLTKLLKPLNIKITRLARGLPMGSDLAYADEVTLGSALQGRREI